jgi:hypothetical protein
MPKQVSLVNQAMKDMGQPAKEMGGVIYGFSTTGSTRPSEWKSPKKE